ncbi:MAG: DUF3168 domain-containing protein [Dehalococcoidia bacterium]
MSVETDVVARLEAAVPLVVNRIYPLLLPQVPTLPAVVYLRVSGMREQSHDGDSALQHPRFQFSCWAETYLEALAVAEEVRIALQGLTTAGVGIYENAHDLYDTDTGWYHVPVDITIWHN